MSTRSNVKFYIDGYSVPVLSYTEQVHQQTDYNGRPSAAPQGGIYRVVLPDTGRWTHLFDDWALSRTMRKECKIEEQSFDGYKMFKTLEFLDTFCVRLEYVDGGADGPFYVLVISAATVVRNGEVVISKWWRKTDPALRNQNIAEEVEEEDTQVVIDIYIDSQTGHRFPEINPNTDIYRIIHYMDYTDILEKYPDSINSKEAIDELKSLSQEVTFDDTLIQTLMQKTQNNSRITEYQVYIVIERDWVDPLNAPATITAEEDMHTKLFNRKDGLINMNIDSKVGRNKKIYHLSPKGNLVIAQVHGHNKTQINNQINIEGTSLTDSNTAISNRFNIYSLRAYETKVGGQAIIDKVDGKGIPSLNIGATRGRNKNTNKKATFDIGRDALDFWSKNAKHYIPSKK
ncbi:type VI secretion system tube protein TssD [Aquimarina aquimarini]|uniref:type VI secretion system tube protein TssD n=1 Tax=Aquimarina aquimarini TaxID=1191734 RepID=UPI001F1D40AE|nr:type VI secretion system tube protein TssD [Aquimarina aquimarini]